MNDDESKQLERSIDEIMEIAEGFGLDFYPMRFEVCPAEIIYTIGAYGMPTRFSHWSFGKAFHKMKMQYDLGLSKIYELVINSNPCYAFLLEGNSLIQNKLIAAHVIAHCDFFKNNARFANTNRDMVESMSASAERIRHYEQHYGVKRVETFIDAVLAIQEHVDPSLVKPFVQHAYQLEQEKKRPHEHKALPPKEGEYDDLWKLEEKSEPESSETVTFPQSPQKDLMWFIGEYAPKLEDWQRDILTVLREEMLYFWPQMETKIMNEGWASYWHSRILRELDLTSEETIEYAKLNASVVQPSRHSLNPYYLGLKIFEDIEKRWDHPTEEMRAKGAKDGKGREKIFEVREFDLDTSFVRNYMTKQLVEDLDLYVFQKQGFDWKVTDKNWESVREQLIASRVNSGFPYILVKDGDFSGRGELYLTHAYEGQELDVKYVERTLPYVVELWGKTVHLETVIEDKSVLFSCDGKQCKRKFLSA